ncbi:hypothetical protein WJX84_000035 [Apatococcus fuscideae]|uniref:Uncharacterized protein n=1 Tax=Apatococcus fuscideae TaxID=2026836 RepID=A0AAW1T408_9CHLO
MLEGTTVNCLRRVAARTHEATSHRWTPKIFCSSVVVLSMNWSASWLTGLIGPPMGFNNLRALCPLCHIR